MSSHPATKDETLLETFLREDANKQPIVSKKVRSVKRIAERRFWSRGMLSSMAGLSIIATIQLLSVSPIDFALTIALCAFIISIPLLAATIMCTLIEQDYIWTGEHTLFGWAASAGIVIPGFGLWAIFYHFDFILGILFPFTCWIAWIVFESFEKSLKQANKER